jgi:hypothetical protein
MQSRLITTSGSLHNTYYAWFHEHAPFQQSRKWIFKWFLLPGQACSHCSSILSQWPNLLSSLEKGSLSFSGILLNPSWRDCLWSRGSSIYYYLIFKKHSIVLESLHSLSWYYIDLSALRRMLNHCLLKYLYPYAL